MTREQAIAFLNRRLEQVAKDPDKSGGYYDYLGDLSYAIKQLEQGPDEEKYVEEVLSNV